ncbi:MAG: molybdate ABC transporter substrate-binding protein [Cloacibacillus evryensis]
MRHRLQHRRGDLTPSKWWPPSKDTHKPIVYPAAIMKNTKQKAAAEAFVKFLKGDACSDVFKKIGFAIPEK